MKNWFKNLQVYCLPKGWSLPPEKWGAALAPFAFTAPASMDAASTGWSKVHNVGKQLLLVLTTEKKVMPTGAVKLVLAKRLIELEQQQGFRPGRKQTKEIKEQITDELLPRAMSVQQHTRVWIDQMNGWVGIDAVSPVRADEVLKYLLKAVDKFPIENLRTETSPNGAMTDWLGSDYVPDGFTIDQDTELRATGESRATVKYTRHTLNAADMASHIDAGKHCTRLAMMWADKISFVLTDSGALCSIAALGILQEPTSPTEDQDERFDHDFVLMTGEFNRLLGDLVFALGGKVAAC